MKKGSSVQNSGLKIKRRLIGGAIFCAGFLLAVCLGIKILLDLKKNASAIDSKEPEFVGGVIFNDSLEEMRKTYDSGSKRSLGSTEKSGASNLPAQYNSRTADSRLSNVRTKNQGDEGLCWLYAASTTLEYSLLKTNKNGTIAPKLMDYQLVEAEDAYKQDDEQNIYADQYVLLAEAVNEWQDKHPPEEGEKREPWSEEYRSLGSGGDKNQIEFILSNPLALMNETRFASIIQENDSNLKGLPTLSFYDQIHDTPFRERVNIPYTVKQDYDQINDQDSIDYIVTDIKEIHSNYQKYSVNSNDDKKDEINEVKRAVQQYGAVEVMTAWRGDSSRCLYVKNETTTVIDRSMPGVENECRADGYEEGHATTVIGWDDNFEYKDDKDTSYGAFILQNSWGETEHEYYLAYNSSFDILYFDSIENFDDYDEIYTMEDYENDDSEPYSYIFNFNIGNKKEEIQSLSFIQIFWNNMPYDIYLKTEDSGEYEYIDSVVTHTGMTKYALDDPEEVSGEFSIKLERPNDAIYEIRNYERVSDSLNLYVNNIDTPTPDPDPDPEPEPDPDPEPDPEPTPPTYTLYFDLDGGNGNIITQTCTPATINETCSVTIPNIEPTKPNYRFFGYSGPNNLVYKQGDTFTFQLNKTEVILRAIWANGTIVSKRGSNHTLGSGENLIIRIDYPVDFFRSVKIDNVALIKDSDYAVRSGSTIITINGDYLDRFDEGSHIVRIIFGENNDIEVLTNFTIAIEEEIPVPNTSVDTDTDKKTNTTPDTGINTKDVSFATRNYCIATFVGLITSAIAFYLSKKYIKK